MSEERDPISSSETFATSATSKHKSGLLLRHKLPLATFLLTLSTSLLVCLVMIYESGKALTAAQLNSLENENRVIGLLFDRVYKELSNDIVSISQLPSTKGFVTESSSATGVTNLSKQRLTTYVKALAAAKPYYLQVRIIGAADEGKEVIRINRNLAGGDLVQVADDELQMKGTRFYFQQTMMLAEGEVFFSRIELNREYGKISLPETPVIRVATPLFDEVSGERFGIAIINFDYNYLFDYLTERLPSADNLIIADASGDFLYHPDKMKAFAFERGPAILFQDEFPQVASLSRNDTGGSLVTVTHAIAGSAPQLRKAFYGSIPLSTYSVDSPLKALIYFDPKTEALIAEVRNQSLLLALFLSVLVLALVIFAMRRLLGPLEELTTAVRHYKLGDPVRSLPLAETDEIGVLANAFVKAVKRLERLNHKLVLAKREAEDSAASTTAIVNNAADGIISTDDKGTVLSFNQAASDMFGYTAADMVGTSITRLMPEPERGEHDESMRSYIARNGSDPMKGVGRQFTGQHASGRTFPLEISLSEINVASGKNFVGVLRDISKQRAAESLILEAKQRAEESAMLKSEFLAKMSHEIRTPMNGVIGMQELLLSGDLSRQERYYAEIAHSSATSLLTIINDILDFSKIEAGRLSLEQTDFDIRRCLSDICETMALKVQEKGLEFILDIDPALPNTVRGDPGRLRQILNNLIGNALKFTDEGEILLSVRLASPAERGNDSDVTLAFAVRDTGIGIPEGEIDRLFQSFTQLDNSTTRHYGGTGLGLPIAQQLIELMGGHISIKSQPGEGSEFTFQVQLGVCKDAHEIGPKTEFHGKRILIVDDNATNREALRRQLASWGFEVVEADGGKRALGLLIESTQEAGQLEFWAAILDHQMPDMDGATLSQAIRSETSICDLPLIMMSSLGAYSTVNMFEEVGVSVCLTKPVNPSDLYHSIALLLGVEEISDFDNDSTMPKIARITREKRGVSRLLLVEDNITNQAVAIGMLKKLGLTCDVVNDGQAALDAIREAKETTPYTMILMDCQMPVLDGYQTTRLIRSDIRLPKQSLPIIAMTANAMQGDREKCLAAGMNDYLGKPFKLNELQSTLSRWL